MDFPQTIGKYEILGKIGEGGFATVYRARHNTLHNEVALKVLDPARANDEATRLSFHQEAQVTANLKHPQIVKIYGFFQTEANELCIPMDYFPEGDLKKWQKKHGALSVPAALRVLQDVASALDYAHSQGLVHRDVKPSNIFMDGQGRAYLGDFGLVYLTTETKPQTKIWMAGTPEYFSPEQAQGQYQELKARSDQYSLGVVAYELLVGHPPFKVTEHATSARNVIGAMHIREAPMRPSEARKELPPEVDEPLLKALAKPPAQRYTSCQEFVRNLEEAWAKSRLRLYRDALQEAEAELVQRHYPEAQVALTRASELMPEHEAWRVAQRNLAEAQSLAEAYQSCCKALEDAKQEAANVLTVEAKYPDPEGLFVKLKLRQPPTARFLWLEPLRVWGVGLLVGGLGAVVILAIAWWWITLR